MSGLDNIISRYVVDKTNINDIKDKSKIKEENIINLEISNLISFKKGQPFSLYTDIKKEEMKESIKENGILTPIIVRKIENEKYEIISGHNRVLCCKELGILTIPAQVVDCDDEKAVLIMLDTNLCNRDKILPVEKGYAYKLKNDILKNQTEVSDTNDYKKKFQKGIEDRNTQIFRYIRLTELIKPLQEKVNNEKLTINAGVDISFLNKEEQEIVNQVIEDEQIKLSLVQAQKIKLKKNQITYELVLKIVKNEKVKIEKFTGKVDKKIIKTYKNKFNSDKQFNDLIMELLEQYFKSDSDG